jgi:2'-phosphotransferase
MAGKGKGLPQLPAHSQLSFSGSQPAPQGKGYGGKEKASGKGKRHYNCGGHYQNGFASWQVLSPDDYMFLETSHGGHDKLNRWSRDRLISFSCICVLRHANHYELSRPMVQLDCQGFMPVEDMLQLRIFSAMQTTLEDLNRILATADKVRAEITEKDGKLQMRVLRGHSKRAGAMVCDDEALVRANPSDPDWKDFMLHGTKLELVNIIRDTGLKAGGTRGASYRKHIHLVREIESAGEVEGVRGGSDAIMLVDVKAAWKDGCVFFKSKNGVMLTEGFDGCLPPEYLAGVRKRFIGGDLMSTYTPELNSTGVPEQKAEAQVSSTIPALSQEKQTARKQAGVTLALEDRNEKHTEHHQSLRWSRSEESSESQSSGRHREESLIDSDDDFDAPPFDAQMMTNWRHPGHETSHYVASEWFATQAGKPCSSALADADGSHI